MTPISLIINIVSRRLGVPRALMLGDVRVAHVVRARHTAIWLARRITGASTTVIGRAFGQRDHTTVLYALKKMDGLLERNSSFAEGLIRLGLAVEMESQVLDRYFADRSHERDAQSFCEKAFSLAQAAQALSQAADDWYRARHSRHEALTRSEFRRALDAFNTLSTRIYSGLSHPDIAEDTHGQIEPRQNDSLQIQCAAIAG
jgi:hypothetical protein